MLEELHAELDRQLRQHVRSAQVEKAMATGLIAIARGEGSAALAVLHAPQRDLAWRLAWLVFVVAPVIDESFILTMPMRLEMVIGGVSRLGQLLDDLRDEAALGDCSPARLALALAACLRLDLPGAREPALRLLVEAAACALRNDPTVHDRIIASIASRQERGSAEYLLPVVPSRTRREAPTRSAPSQVPLGSAPAGSRSRAES